MVLFKNRLPYFDEQIRKVSTTIKLLNFTIDVTRDKALHADTLYHGFIFHFGRLEILTNGPKNFLILLILVGKQMYC